MWIFRLGEKSIARATNFFLRLALLTSFFLVLFLDVCWLLMCLLMLLVTFAL